jgi:hypothetical protein
MRTHVTSLLSRFAWAVDVGREWVRKMTGIRVRVQLMRSVVGGRGVCGRQRGFAGREGSIGHIDRIVVKSRTCVCLHGTCYHNFKGLIHHVWSLRHGPPSGRLDAYCKVAGCLRPTSDPLGGSGGGGTPAGVVASVAACVPIVSRYNKRVCLTRLGRGVILCLPCVCSPNNCHRTAPHRIASRRTAQYRIA